MFSTDREIVFLFIFLVTSVSCVILYVSVYSIETPYSLVRLEFRDIWENPSYSFINEKLSKIFHDPSLFCLLLPTVKWSTNLHFIVNGLHSKWHLSMKKHTSSHIFIINMNTSLAIFHYKVTFKIRCRHAVSINLSIVKKVNIWLDENW